jgi:hypothetical protein
VVVYEIAQDGLAPLMRVWPSIAPELGAFLSRRAVDLDRLQQGLEIVNVQSAPSLTARIRHLFDI